MELTPNNIVLVSAVLLLSVFAGRTGSRYGLPVLVLFLGVGMLAGVDGFDVNTPTAKILNLPTNPNP